jgi:hypothetical protein
MFGAWRFETAWWSHLQGSKCSWRNMTNSAWTFWHQKTRPQHCLRILDTNNSMTCHHISGVNCTTAKAQKLTQSHAVTHLLQQRKREKVLKKAVLRGIWGWTKDCQTCKYHGDWGNLHGKHCVATWRLVDFSRDWRCYAEFTFWIQRQLIMN